MQVRERERENFPQLSHTSVDSGLMKRWIAGGESENVRPSIGVIVSEKPVSEAKITRVPSVENLRFSSKPITSPVLGEERQCNIDWFEFSRENRSVFKFWFRIWENLSSLKCRETGIFLFRMTLFCQWYNHCYSIGLLREKIPRLGCRSTKEWNPRPL